MNINGTGIWSAQDVHTVIERDSIECAHCGNTAFKKPRTASRATPTLPRTIHTGPIPLPKEQDADLGGCCQECDSFICGPCTGVGICTPFLLRVERSERIARMMEIRGLFPKPRRAPSAPQPRLFVMKIDEEVRRRAMLDGLLASR